MNKKIITMGIVCIFPISNGIAFAQEAADGDNSGEIIVTAQKRSERLLDVPMSISATSGEQLETSGIGSTRDLQQVTPGLVTVSNGFAFTPAVRGVSSVGTSPGDETNVSVYLDDVYMGAPMGGLFDLKDIERVEVLKGPQGTLFGRNATGGAVRVVTKAPSFEPHAELSADYGFDFNTLNMGAYLTAGFSDTVAGSINLIFNDDDGYVKGIGPQAGRRFGANKIFAVRGKLLFQPSEALKMTIAADYADRLSSQIYAWSPKTGTNVNQTRPGYILSTPFRYAGSTQPIANMKTGGVSLDVNWTPSDAVTVRSISAYRDAKGLFQPDSDRTNLSLGALRLRQKQNNFSQEFNISGPADTPLAWLAGLYYYHSDAGNPFFSAYTNDAPNGTVGSSFSDTVKTNAYAAFGELTWNATDQLHLTGGLRYTSEKKHFRFRDLIRAAGIRTADVAKRWESTTFRAVARYDIADNANIYASVSDGFKSGVFNAYALPAVPVSPEKIRAYEVGAKAKLAGVTITAAAFAYNYKNIQVQGNTLVGNAFVVTLANAARAKIRGYELTASGKLGDKLGFNLGVSGLPKADYAKFTAAQVFIPNPATGGLINTVPYDASGSRLIRAPKVTANAALTYTDTLFDGKFVGAINYAHNSGFFWQPGNLTHENSYGIMNAKLAWTEPSGRYTVSVWASNLTDTTYSFYSTASTAAEVDSLARPREIGIGISAKF